MISFHNGAALQHIDIINRFILLQAISPNGRGYNSSLYLVFSLPAALCGTKCRMQITAAVFLCLALFCIQACSDVPLYMGHRV